MSDGTHIEWTDATLNVVNGCTVVSPGCEHCYAMRLAATRLQHHESREGLARMHNGHPQWTGEVRFNEKVLLDPLHWRRPRKIFWNAHGDLFHEAVPDEWIDRCVAVMALTQHHIHQVLTKRPERMRAYFRGHWHVRIIEYLRAYDPEIQQSPGRGVLLQTTDGVLPNVWLGVSVEDQKRANERVPILLDTPAAVRWLSCEPLLGPVDLESAWHGETALDAECWGDCGWCTAGYTPLHNCRLGRQEGGGWVEHPKGRSGLDWIVVGGESGPGARPMHPDWARSLRDQCAAAEVPFLFKQWGNWKPLEASSGYWPADAEHCIRLTPEGQRTDAGWPMQRLAKHIAGRQLDGVEHNGYPA